MSKKKRILITGGSGLVGDFLVRHLSKSHDVLSPGRTEFDLLKPVSIGHFMEAKRPQVIVHAAAFTDADLAESQRGDEKGVCWATNVEATKELSRAADLISASVIYISTGSVFSGTDDHPGPFVESDKPNQDPKTLSWYGWTKYNGEKNIDIKKHAIVRLSHPIGDGKRADYARRLLAQVIAKTIYPLFIDQVFPITNLADLVWTVDRLIYKWTPGIYHVASPDRTTPAGLVEYMLRRMRKSQVIEKISFTDFIRSVDRPLRFSQYSALSVEKTQAIIGYEFSRWTRTIDLLQYLHGTD